MASPAPAPEPIVTLAEIEAAAARIEGAVVRTPTLLSRTLSEATGAKVWVKFENLQFTAAYKERGALNRLLQLTEEERARGLSPWKCSRKHRTSMCLSSRSVGAG